MPAAAKRNIQLNQDTNLLKLFAIVAMTLDHVGKMFFPQFPILRILGRLAFPLFCYCLAVGAIRTHSLPKYLLRIAILAAVSQPIYVVSLDHVSAAMRAVDFSANFPLAALRWYALSWHHPGVLVSLFAGLALIGSIQSKRYIVTGVLTLTVWMFQNYLDYGLNGIILMILFYAFVDRPLASLAWVLGFMVYMGSRSGGYSLYGFTFSTQMFAIFALPLIYLKTDTGLKLPRYLFYLFYPGHLLAIYAIEQLL